MIYDFPNSKVVNQHRYLSDNVDKLKMRLSRFDKYADRTILSSAHGADGLKLSSKQFNSILSYLNAPDVYKWAAIYKIQISPNQTLWQAWNKVAKNKVFSIKNTDKLDEKWLKIPEPGELIIGVKKTINAEKSKLSSIIDKINFEMSLLEFKYKNYLTNHVKNA